MRKKSHRRINANNREYDRFYVINYLVKTLRGGNLWPLLSIKSSLLCDVRSWGRPGRRCRARTMANWWTMDVMSTSLKSAVEADQTSDRVFPPQ